MQWVIVVQLYSKSISQLTVIWPFGSIHHSLIQNSLKCAPWEFLNKANHVWHAHSSLWKYSGILYGADKSKTICKICSNPPLWWKANELKINILFCQNWPKDNISVSLQHQWPVKEYFLLWGTILSLLRGHVCLVNITSYFL